MRRLVVAAITVSLALLLVGCGGGGEAETSTSKADNTAAATDAGAGSASTLPDISDKSANESSTFEPFPTGTSVPADLQQKINVEKQATLIYFYDSGQKTSGEVRDTIDAVRNEHRGLVDFVAYDIGKYVTTHSDGSITIDPALADNSAAVAAVTLARDPAIGVSFTPFIVLTDDQGYIIFKHHGLIDYAFLEREVQRAAP